MECHQNRVTIISLLKLKFQRHYADKLGNNQ